MSQWCQMQTGDFDSIKKGMEFYSVSVLMSKTR